MAQDAYPVPGRVTSLAEWRAFARTFAFGAVQSGLRVVGDSTGLQVKVSSGDATVDGIFYRSTAQEVLTIEPNSSGNRRIDAVLLRLDPTADPPVQLAVRKGVPAGSPTSPALTQDPVAVWEEKLAEVTVASGAVTIPASAVSADMLRGDRAHDVERVMAYAAAGDQALGAQLAATRNELNARITAEIAALRTELNRTKAQVTRLSAKHGEVWN